MSSSEYDEDIYDAILSDQADNLASYHQRCYPILEFRTKKQQSILHLAVSNSSFRILDYLGTLSLPKTFINARNDYNETALHLVAAIGDVSLLRRLLALFDVAWDMSMTDKWGRTASHIAMQNGYHRMIGPQLLPSPIIQSLPSSSSSQPALDPVQASTEDKKVLEEQRKVVQVDFLNQLQQKQQQKLLHNHHLKHATLVDDNNDYGDSSGDGSTSVSRNEVLVKHLFADQTHTESIYGTTSTLSNSNYSNANISNNANNSAINSADNTSNNSNSTNNGTRNSANNTPKAIGQPAQQRAVSSAISLSKIMEYPGDVVHLQSLSNHFLHSRNDTIDENEVSPLYDINGRDFYGINALQKACSWNKVDIVSWLLTTQKPFLRVKDAVPATAKEHAGWTAVHFCVDSAAVSCLEALLLHCNEDMQELMSMANTHGETPLQMAQVQSRQGGGYAATSEQMIALLSSF